MDVNVQVGALGALFIGLALAGVFLLFGGTGLTNIGYGSSGNSLSNAGTLIMFFLGGLALLVVVSRLFGGNGGDTI
jgi:hypothetical protein